MAELVECPFCKRPLSTRLIVDFWFCEECGTAVRKEDDMPMRNMEIYNERWVEAQEKNKYILKKAYYLLGIIRQLHGVSHILDIGSGTGILVDILSRSGYIATGIDSSPAAIAFAERRKQGNFELVSIESFEGKGKYDLIVATQVIEHLRYPEILLMKARDLLKPMGWLLLETPNLNSWSKKSLWRRRIGGMFYGTDHRICYTSQSLVHLLRDSGFNIYKLITRTYSPTMFVELMKTLRSAFGNDRKEPLHGSSANRGGSQCSSVKNIRRNIYTRVIGSPVVDAFSFVPNRISEIAGRGNQLIAIAKKSEEEQHVLPNRDEVNQETRTDQLLF